VGKPRLKGGGAIHGGANSAQREAARDWDQNEDKASRTLGKKEDKSLTTTGGGSQGEVTTRRRFDVLGVNGKEGTFQPFRSNRNSAMGP